MYSDMHDDMALGPAVCEKAEMGGRDNNNTVTTQVTTYLSVHMGIVVTV